MEYEKILFCYRDDKLKKPFIHETNAENKLVVALPCQKRILGKDFGIKKERIQKWIREIYELGKADYLWLEDELCDYLKMERMDLPDSLISEWLNKIPFYHTLIFADNISGVALRFLTQKTDKVAMLGVVCYKKDIDEYENLARELFLKEGIVLQVFTYENLQKSSCDFTKELVTKGRTALLDLDMGRGFWDKRLKKEIAYYSFRNENRLFLDTFKKNRYNTLTK